MERLEIEGSRAAREGMNAALSLLCVVVLLPLVDEVLIHATVDALGNPTGVHLTRGQAHDLDGADVLLADIQADAVIAGRAYDAYERLVQPLQQAGPQIVIPSKPVPSFGLIDDRR